MRNNLKFNLPDRYKEQLLISELADQYAIKKESAISERFAIYDTFDWRLLNKSLVLYRSGSKLSLRKLEKSEIESVRYVDYKEQFSPFALAGLRLLTLETILRTTWFRRLP